MSFAARTLIGEGFAGSGPDAAHLNTVLGRKGGPVETAWAAPHVSSAWRSPRRSALLTNSVSGLTG